MLNLNFHAVMWVLGLTVAVLALFRVAFWYGDHTILERTKRTIAAFRAMEHSDESSTTKSSDAA